MHRRDYPDQGTGNADYGRADFKPAHPVSMTDASIACAEKREAVPAW